MPPFLDEYGCTRDTMICVVSISIIAIITMVVVPFCVHCTYKFYYYRRDQGIILRYPTTLTLSSILNILYMFVVIQYKIFDAGISHNIFLWISPIISNPYLILIILINIFRLWLIHYDTNCKIIQSRANWQSLLCSTVNINDAEWYSRYRHKWGNWRWLMKILFLLWLFLSILCVTPLFLSHSLSLNIYEKTADILYSSTVIILLLFAVVIWYKMPTFEDTFHILKELKILITTSVILCVIWFSLIFWSEEGNIFSIAQIFIIFLFVFIQIFISEFMVMRMISKINAHYTKKYDSDLILRNSTLFRIIIATDIGLEQYFQHVQKEFSHENLLFFIEMIQWLRAATNQQWKNYDIGAFSEQSIQYTFAKIIPCSSINSNTESDWYEKMLQLYNKYICENSQFQVNLPDAHRKEFTSLIHLYQMKQDIATGLFSPRLIKKKNTINIRQISVSKSKSTRNRKLFTLRRNRTAQRKPPVIKEPKASDDPQHIRYSKSLEARPIKKREHKEVKFARMNTSPPVNVHTATVLYNAKSADDAIVEDTIVEDTILEDTIMEDTMMDDNTIRIHNDHDTDCVTDAEKSAPPHAELQLLNYSLTITNVDENAPTILIKAPSAPVKTDATDKEDAIMDLEDIYMGIITENTPPANQEVVVANKVIKSVTFHDIDSDPDHSDVGSDTEEADDRTRIHRSNEPTLVSIISSVGSLSDHGADAETFMITAKEPLMEQLDSTQSYETIKESDIMHVGNSTKSLQLDNIYTETEKSSNIKMRLSDIKEEDKSAESPPNPQTEPDLHKKGTQESKLDDFLEDVNRHIDEEEKEKEHMHGTKEMRLSTTSFANSSDYSSALTMNAIEFEYSVRKNLENKHQRKGASGISMLFGSGFSKAFSSIFMQRSPTLQLSTLSDDEKAQNVFVIDPIVQKEMETAKTIDVTQFVTASCFALNQVLNLSNQSVSRFKNSKYFQTFNDNVNLEQLVKEYEDKYASV